MKSKTPPEEPQNKDSSNPNDAEAIQSESGVLPELPKPIPLEPDLELPEYIGSYKIEGLYERGGMSYLYMGIHPHSNEMVLVKVLSPKFVTNQEVVSRFLNEAKIISRTDHPNIVKLYDYGEWENGLYIAMEFIRGTPLRKILMQQPFSLRRALDIILQTAYALCHLHTHGVIHGDLKPENIIITDKGNVKVIDFGIARCLSDHKVNLDDMTKLIGTPIYMSPEQRDTPQYISFQSDIYSLGILAYELVIGKITHGRVILSLAPRGMQKILTKALQQRAEDRYQDIVDFITDVTNYINSGDIHRDKQGSDYFFELFESMENMQGNLIPHELPAWEGLEIGLAHSISMGLPSLYYDFFLLPQDTYLFFSAKCPSKGGIGVLEAAMLRAQIRAFTNTIQKDSIEKFAQAFIQLYEKHISADLFNTTYEIAFIVFDKKNGSCHLYQKEFGYFYHYQKLSHRLVPLECLPFLNEPFYRNAILTLQPGDRLLFAGVENNFSNRKKLSLQLFYNTFLETIEISPQKQTDHVLRKIRLQAPPSWDEQPICLASFMVLN